MDSHISLFSHLFVVTFEMTCPSYCQSVHDWILYQLYNVSSTASTTSTWMLTSSWKVKLHWPRVKVDFFKMNFKIMWLKSIKKLWKKVDCPCCWFEIHVESIEGSPWFGQKNYHVYLVPHPITCWWRSESDYFKCSLLME